MDFPKIFRSDILSYRDRYLENLTEENKERLRNWIKALKSGNYSQAQSNLRTYRGYCCMGVMCDIFDQGRWVESNAGMFIGYEYEYEGTNEFELPHDKIYKLYGVDENLVHQFAEWNDEYNFTFSEIANAVEWFFNLA